MTTWLNKKRLVRGMKKKRGQKTKQKKRKR
jgi:hypothetical protein